ncbi:MAG TPA: TatD family hydrolase [Candidatus Saccharimonadales bacterium]|nr:TatD family hydrolase [Candidatus Saccharimonadales bacterium]
MSQPTLTDTHCHIHEAQGSQAVDSHGVSGKWRQGGGPGPAAMIAEAQAAGVTRLICVGTTVRDSEQAAVFAAQHTQVWASIGVHPHEADDTLTDPDLKQLSRLVERPKVVAVGECGLDYFYQHASRKAQKALLHHQIELAIHAGLPLIFHVRDAFDDFWPIFDSYTGLRGVVHSFTATPAELQRVLDRGLYVGLNGIMTFTREPQQLAAAKAVPLDRLLLETDAPFLTPSPFRGTICQPKHVRVTADFLGKLRDEPLETLAAVTTRNAQTLFGLKTHSQR